MAYSLTYSGNQTGGVQTILVPDGGTYVIGNVTLPGRNFNNYGGPVDQNMLSMIENFASSATGPAGPVTGQLWYDKAAAELRYNISTSATPTWASVPTQDANGNATLANAEVTGNFVVDGNTTMVNVAITGNTTMSNVAVTGNTTLVNVAVTGTTTLANVAVTGNTTMVNVAVTGTTTLANATANNVTANNFIGGNISGNFTGNITGNLTAITTGAVATPGTITGQWTLTAGSTLNSTFADLAERHHSDAVYSVGTVMTVGGVNEVTAAQSGSTVLGVVSNAYAYLMNSVVGDDATHPAVAYVGRVPVRVVGAVERHAKLTASANGTATTALAGDSTFGWALESNADVAEKLVLCIIK